MQANRSRRRRNCVYLVRNAVLGNILNCLQSTSFLLRMDSWNTNTWCKNKILLFWRNSPNALKRGCSIASKPWSRKRCRTPRFFVGLCGRFLLAHTNSFLHHLRILLEMAQNGMTFLSTSVQHISLLYLKFPVTPTFEFELWALWLFSSMNVSPKTKQRKVLIIRTEAIIIQGDGADRCLTLFYSFLEW